MRQNSNDMRGAKIHSSLSEGKKLKVDQYNQSDLLVTEEKLHYSIWWQIFLRGSLLGLMNYG